MEAVDSDNIKVTIKRIKGRSKARRRDWEKCKMAKAFNLHEDKS